MKTFWRQFGLLNSLISYYAFPFKLRLMRQFYAQFVSPGCLCFDIGAHVGDRVRALTQLGAQVVAVEPQPHLFRFLERMYGKNPAVRLVEAAAGAQAGRQTLWISERTPTVSSLSLEWIRSVRSTQQFRTTAWQTPVEVQVTTLDTLIARFGRPDFCKVDVEGFEAEVLNGLSQPLQALSIEYHPAAMEAVLGCIDRLENLDDYEYNWTVSELPRWQSPDWLAAGAVGAILRALPADARSGDLYARRIRRAPGAGRKSTPGPAPTNR